MKNKGAVLFGAFGILAFIFLAGIYLNNNTSQQRIIDQVATQQEKHNSTKEKEIKTFNDYEVKELFKVKELISNNLPGSIDFLTEATCPGDGFASDYIFDNRLKNYYFDSCENVNSGNYSQSGNQKISKIRLLNFFGCEGGGINSRDYYQQGNKRLFVESWTDEDCLHNTMRVYGTSEDQEFKGLLISFNSDYNFDGFNDIAIQQIQAQNNSFDYYLYDEVYNKFVLNEKLSNLPNLEIDKDKKILYSKGSGWGTQALRIYKYENKDLRLVELFLYDSDFCAGECPIQYSVNHDGSSEIVSYEGFNVDERDLHGNTRLMKAFSSNSFELAKNLIDAGANLHLKNNKNEMAIEIARRSNSVSILKEWDSNIKTIEIFYNYLKKFDYENAYKMYNDQVGLGYANFKDNYSQIEIYDIDFNSMNEDRYIFTIKYACSDMVGDCLMYDVEVLIEEGKIVSINNN